MMEDWMRALMLLALVPVSTAALSARADDGAAYTLIADGAYTQAESRLRAEMRIYGERPELLLNLAAVYARTGREAEARSLYVRVLRQDEVLMDLDADRSAGSHAIARTGLRRLERVQFTAR
jgi:hypothetical protein